MNAHVTRHPLCSHAYSLRVSVSGSDEFTLACVAEDMARQGHLIDARAAGIYVEGFADLRAFVAHHAALQRKAASEAVVVVEGRDGHPPAPLEDVMRAMGFVSGSRLGRYVRDLKAPPTLVIPR